MKYGFKEDRSRNEEKLEAPEIRLTSKNRAASKFSDFWYYHKWKVIIIAFFAIIFIVGVVQMINKDDGDEIVMIAVPADVTAEEQEKIDSILTSLMPKNDDGSDRKLDVYLYPIYSEEEMKAANESEIDEEGRYITKVLHSYNMSKQKEYDQFLSTGESSVMLISEYLYEKLVANGRVRPLSDLFGEKLPVGAMKDGFGVRLGDTYIYDFFPDMQKLPEGTVVCLLRQYIHGASSDSERYAASEDLFKNIVTFGQE